MSVYQNMNQLMQSAIKGAIAGIVNPNTISVMVYVSSVATIRPGSAVKLVDVTGDTIIVDLCAATDAPLGFAIFSPKKTSWVAGDALEIALPGSIVYAESQAAIARGASLEFVVSGNLVKTNAGINPISAVALDKASAANQLIRILVRTYIETTHVITGGSINSTPIGASVPSTGVFTVLSAGSTALTPAATVGINCALANVFTLTPAEDEAISASGLIAGQVVYLKVLTSGTTSRTLTFGTGIKSQGTLATGTVTAKVFMVEFLSDGVSLNEVARSVAM